MTLLVIAHERDTAAQRLVQAWRPHAARLLLPRDLSRPGWRFYVGGRGEQWFVAEAQRQRTAELRGVLCRLPLIEPAMLTQLQARDRVYAATEMNAFLIAWLRHLHCPVLNRVSTSSMLGPAITLERWLALATSLGLAVRPRPAGHSEEILSGCNVSVIGGQWFGEAAPELGVAAVRLARVAGVEMLTAQFVGPNAGAAFVAADLWVDIERADVAAALLQRFTLGAAA